MYKFNNIKQGILIASLVTLLTGCGGGGSTAAATGTTSSSSPITTEKTIASTTVTTAIQKGQVKDSSTGQGIENVKVSIGNTTTMTDANGYYGFSDLTSNEEAVVNFEKEGYLLGSTQVQLKSLAGDNSPSINYLEYSMYAHDYQYNLNSTEEILGARIFIDASVSYIDTEGNPYTGTMAVKLTILDNDEDALLKTFPGTFKGINTNGTLVQFKTYGMTSIFLKDSKGNRLYFADGETGTLIFKSISSLDKPDTLPLWFYDYKQGLWFEEGYAQLQADGTYKGEISHLGTWSLNKPVEEEAGIYRGRIISEDGSPMSDVRLQAIGTNWISSDLSTNENGVFEIKVIPGKSFQLSAYNYKDKYKASYNNTISAIASGDIVEE